MELGYDDSEGLCNLASSFYRLCVLYVDRGETTVCG